MPGCGGSRPTTDAIEAGAREASPVALAFSGQRMGAVRDPFGHRWVIATEVEHLSAQEIQRRMEDAMNVDIA